MALRHVPLVVGLICTLAGPGLHADGDIYRVIVHLHVERGLTSKRVVDRVKEEAAAIWAAHGVGLDWSDGWTAGPGVDGPALEAFLDRRIASRARMSWLAVLGSVTVRSDEPHRRPIHISLEATERMLATRASLRASRGGVVLNVELARALGRVLAHEIGHVLLDAGDHDDAGLMRAVFPPEQLGEHDPAPFRLTCAGVRRLRQRLLTWTGRQSTEPAFADDRERDSWPTAGDVCIAAPAAK